MKYFSYVLILLLSLHACSEKKSKTISPIDASKPSRDIKNNGVTKTNAQIDRKSPEIIGITGISTNPNVQIKAGIVEITVKSGILETDHDKKIILLKDNELNGILSLKDAVTNAKVNGTIEIKKEDRVRFIPETDLDSKTIYDISFVEDQTNLEHSERIFISAANYCNPSSAFSLVPIQKLPRGTGKTISLEIKANIFKHSKFGQVAIIGWDHLSSKSFNFKIDQQSNGAKYKIVAAYGTYNIPEHECELYLQRDINSPFPTWVDSNYAAKTTAVTEEDTSIRNPITKEFYGFSKTYILVKVFNSANVDITPTDTGILSLEQTDSLYGLPVSLNNEEESSLLAYLNRGNNNSYSMALGGLIVGIFGFFLSRRLMQKKEDD